MTDLIISGNLRQRLASLIPGKPQPFWGIGVEKLQAPAGLYRIGKQKQLLTLNEVTNFIYKRKMQLEPQLAPREIPTNPIYPDSLRAMTCHFPYAWAIVKGFKAEEYRSRTLRYRGVFLLHAGQSKASDRLIREWRIPAPAVAKGAILGAARLVDSLYEGDGAVHVLEDAICFPEPIQPVSGQQAQLWKPQDASGVRAFNRAWMTLQDLDYPIK